MRRILLLLSLFLIISLAACSSAEGKEVLEYHNNFVDEVISQVEIIEVAYNKIEYVEYEEVIEILQNEISPALDDIQTYMNAQKPEKDDTKEYHQLRLNEFTAFVDLMKEESQAMEDFVNDKITEEEFNEFLDGLNVKFAEYEVLASEANEKMEELSDKHTFEDSED